MPDGSGIDRHPWRNPLFRASLPENPIQKTECQELLTSLHSHIRTGLLPVSGCFLKVFRYFSQPALFFNPYGNCIPLEFYAGKKHKLLAGSFETLKISITSRNQAGSLFGCDCARMLEALNILPTNRIFGHGCPKKEIAPWMAVGPRSVRYRNPCAECLELLTSRSRNIRTGLLPVSSVRAGFFHVPNQRQ